MDLKTKRKRGAAVRCRRGVKFTVYSGRLRRSVAGRSNRRFRSMRGAPMNGTRARRGSSFRSLAWCLASLLAFATAARATQVRPVNLEEMTDRAATVFSGRCIDVHSVIDPRLGKPVTLMTFEVSRAVKGDLGDTVTIKLLGAVDSSSGKGGVAGLPTFQRDEEVVLFLYGESSMGLTSPVGFGQGKFTIVKTKRGERFALNAFGNKNLLRDLSETAETRLASLRGADGSPGELRPDKLLDMAASLMAAE